MKQLTYKVAGTKYAAMPVHSIYFDELNDDGYILLKDFNGDKQWVLMCKKSTRIMNENYRPNLKLRRKKK